MRLGIALSRILAFTIGLVVLAELNEPTGLFSLQIGSPGSLLAAPLACVECPCPYDPDCNGTINVLDVVNTVGAAFRAQTPASDASCPRVRADGNTDGLVDVLDVVLMMNVAFRGDDPLSTFFDPCVCVSSPGICVPSPVQSSGSVVVESKGVAAGATGVQVGVYVSNEVDIQALVLPFELRSLDPGAFVTTAFSLALVSGHRVANSPLGPAGPNWPTASSTIRRLPSPAPQTCSGPTSSTFTTAAAQIDFVSPDAILDARVSQGDDEVGEVESLVAGADAPGAPSFVFTFNVSNNLGDFIIDTCCTTPANHLSMVEHPSGQLITPSFTPGIVSVGGPLSFFGNPRSGIAPHTVFFTAVNNTGTPVDSWEWNFGDGGTSALQNPTHAYLLAGTYDVTLTATQGGTPTTISRNAYIEIREVEAEFSGFPRFGDNPLAVDFADLSAGTPTSWLWDFGDGSTSTEENPTHIYPDDGEYDVTLTVSGITSNDTELKLGYVYVADPSPDFDVNLYQTGLSRPGFEVCYRIFLKNVGTSSAPSSVITFALPSILTPSTVEPVGSITGNVITWPTPSLDPSNAPVIYEVCAVIPVGTPVGTQLAASASIPGAPSESDLQNNSINFVSTIVASMDPNDLLVSPPGCGAESELYQGEPRLNFTAHFENKPAATAEAIYVLIVDTLDPDLDWSSLQLGPTSHDGVVTIDFDAISGEIRWFFDGINLPPNVTPPEGEGYVTYSISPSSELPEGTVFSNRAHIRFDFNDWLSAPDAGPLDLTLMPCPPCACDCHSDPGGNCDGVQTVLDVVQAVNVAFRNAAAIPDPNGNCPYETTDVNCDDVTSVIDVVKMVNVAFRNANPATEFCDPCP